MPKYMINYSLQEIERLRLQSISYGAATRKLLSLSDLHAGMTVLDVGTGAGEVAIMAANIVGPTGLTKGIDLDARALDHAQKRVAHLGLRQIRFELMDIEDMPVQPLFDLVVGRLVLWCQNDRVQFVRRCASFVKPGGSLAFLEEAISLSNAPSDPSVELYDEAFRLVGKTADAHGFPLTVGGSFIALFAAAGLPEPTLFCEVSIGGARSLAIDLVVANLRAFEPLVKQSGLPFPGNLRPTLLRRRLLKDCCNAQSQLCGIPVVGASVRAGV